MVSFLTAEPREDRGFGFAFNRWTLHIKRYKETYRTRKLIGRVGCGLFWPVSKPRASTAPHYASILK